MTEPVVKIEIGRYKPKWYVNFADFANMVKAFIGSNYLSIAYAFLQSGLVLGLCGMGLIAALTDHCCHLIVKTKHHIIRKHLENMKTPNSGKRGQNQNNYSSIKGNPNSDSGVEDESMPDEVSPFVAKNNGDDSSEVDSEESLSELEEHMLKHLTYGEVGKRCFGGKGLGLVNFFIALTQFGFCVGYFIFIGNTIHSLFPVKMCADINNHTYCQTFYDLDEAPHLNTTTRIDSLHEPVYRVSYPEVLNADPNSTTIQPANISTTIEPANISTKIDPANISTTTFIPPNITTTQTPNTTASFPMDIVWRIVKSKPNLMLLVASPLPIFIIFAFIKSVRALGIISVIANGCILGGCVAVFAFLIDDFEVHATIDLVKFSTFPVFFGMVTAAFEGIGLVIPIESSMVGNRELFPCFLHGAIAVLTFILGGFGVLGYLKFGEDVHQMLNTNIPSGKILSDIVNIGICAGILLTFPLQIYPVIEILEKYLFTEGRICGPPREDTKKKYLEDEDEEETRLIKDEDTDPLLGDDEVVTTVPESVPKCRRYTLRIIVVLIAAGLAVLLKDNFAYVGAFNGAVGSSVLAFILPCLFHLKICWNDINIFIKAKDMFIICFGFVASVISVISVVERIAKNSLEH